MSQVFSADAVNNTTATTVPTSGETVAVVGNFLNPPFQTAKAVVTGSITMGIGAGTTALNLRIRRNPNAEDFNVGQTGLIGVTPGGTTPFSFQAADAIPDGRPVQYALTVVPTGATGTGNIIWASIAVLLISG